MKPVTPSSITSGAEPQPKPTTGVPQAIASIITSPNGSGQSIGNSSAAAPPRKAGFCASLISPMYSISGWSSSGSITFSEIRRVGRIDLGGHLQRHAQALGDLDRPVGPLLRRHAAEEGEIALARPRTEPVSRASACMPW